MEKIVLNLGCGKTRIPGALGVDIVTIENYVDQVHNLDILPYPFESNSVDEIHFYHVIEHLHEPLKKIEELHRILKPGGILHIRTPHFSSRGAFTDITHLRPFGYESFDCFKADHHQHYYTQCVFEIISKKIKYFGALRNSGDYEKYVQPNQSQGILTPIWLAVDFFIAISPKFFERFWCYWVGGAMEVVVDLKKV